MTKNLRQFIRILRENKEIVDITHPVDPNLEIAEIHRRVAAADGPALLFHNVKGSKFPVVTNLFGSLKRVELAFPSRPDRVIANLIKTLTSSFPPKLKPLLPLLKMGTKTAFKAPVCDRVSHDLEELPLLRSWPKDGGHFITLPLVYTEGNKTPNLGMYRIQRYDKKQAGLHFQIQKGGGFHYDMAEKENRPLPVHIFIGGSPALILSAITPLPEHVPEILIASLLQNEKLRVKKHENGYPLITECEFALVGSAPPHVRRPEGPFGDHYGYYSWTHDFPLFKLDKIYHRKDAIYPATVVGKPRQEDFYIGDYLQELLSPIFPVVMPGVKDLWSYGETGFHSLSAAVVKERYHRECMTSAFRILGEGQLSLSKFLLVTDQPVSIRNIKEVLPTILERFHPETDLFIFSNLSLDTLDYTGPELNKGSRGIMLGIGEKKRDLPTTFTGQGRPFCPGCLVVDEKPDLNHEVFKHWPLIIWVDDLEKTLSSTPSFLWTVFTRFEPAADISSASQSVERHHICYRGPILIDARMKPSYPEEVLCDEMTSKHVSIQWNNYFPDGMEMGQSESAHVV
ncbi:MAG: 4-hydroxybenzoate decarboxylase subunit C [Chlamydiales bacterium]|nr:4-hydroxybenzoate decarboxylase subunit C [Chlamydiales bacterium]MCH9620218.1 4-hydroxybenzoate decarboxylase subunit C [Chlamydiales bacterium]MCH9623067.1 4-hydroxybenzoate decarboxylase subunit C [Chlamydiales bacterium]